MQTMHGVLVRVCAAKLLRCCAAEHCPGALISKDNKRACSFAAVVAAAGVPVAVMLWHPPHTTYARYM